MYNENKVYVADPRLNFRLTRREYLRELKESHWRSKLMWLCHPKDTYGKHLERFYNHPAIKKVVFYIIEKKTEEEQDVQTL